MIVFCEVLDCYGRIGDSSCQSWREWDLSMRNDSIEFRGRSYRLRTIDFGGELGVLRVASEHLDELLIDSTGQYISKEAESVDEQIFYFIPAASFRLSDDKLRTKVLSEIR